MPCFTDDEVAAAHARIAMQQAVGLDVRWVASDEFDAMNPAMAPGHDAGRVVRRRATGTSTRRATCWPTPPRSSRAGVEVFERTAFTGLLRRRRRASPACGRRPATIATARVVLTGGPTLAAVGEAAGVRIPAGGARHQVVVTEDHPDFAPTGCRWCFDLASGIYWRPEEGGDDVGDEQPRRAAGQASRVRLGLLRVDARADGAARPDHRDGSACAGSGRRPSTSRPTTCRSSARRSTADGAVAGTMVAAAGGHGMMWGPGVSKAAADLALEGTTDVVDTPTSASTASTSTAAAASTPTPSPCPSPRSPDADPLNARSAHGRTREVALEHVTVVTRARQRGGPGRRRQRRRRADRSTG